MTTPWSSGQLKQIGMSAEIKIAVRRADGRLRRWVPIWVVCVDQDVYVRTSYPRPDGWFGQARESRRARVQVRDVLADVTVIDVGPGSADLRADVDDAYRSKYGPFGDAIVERMIADSAAATTLRLKPE